MNNLATEIGPTEQQGKDSPFYEGVYNAIVSSPSILNQYDTAASASPPTLQRIFYDTAPNAKGVSFNPNANPQFNNTTDTLNLGAAQGNLLSTSTSSTLTAIFGHEIWHVEDNAAVQAAQTSINSAAFTAVTYGTVDLTTYVSSR